MATATALAALKPCVRCREMQNSSSSSAGFSGRSHIHVSAPSRPSVAVRASRSGQGFAPSKRGSLKQEAQDEQQVIQDKLIVAFQSKPQNTWKKLMAFSKQWPNLADGVMKRALEVDTKSTSTTAEQLFLHHQIVYAPIPTTDVDGRIAEEKDPDTKLKLRRFARGLRTAHEEVMRYAAVFKKFEEAEPIEYDAIVAGHRDAFSTGFFEYLQNIIVAEEDTVRQEALVKLGSQISAMVEAVERIDADAAALDAASEKFQSLLTVGSLEEAEQKIDAMAASGELDPAFLLTMAKAYSGVKETDYTRDEVKDLMYHLYVKGKEAAARDAPAEVRILKHLLTIEDPAERSAELANALQKGGELETPTQDFLSTEPKKLQITIDTVLNAYDKSRNKATLLGQTADVMNPVVIARLRELQDIIRNQYL